MQHSTSAKTRNAKFFCIPSLKPPNLTPFKISRHVVVWLIQMSLVWTFKIIITGGATSDRLQQVYKPVLSDAQCSGYLGSSYDSNTMLCAGLDVGGKDACQVSYRFQSVYSWLFVLNYLEIWVSVGDQYDAYVLKVKFTV